MLELGDRIRQHVDATAPPIDRAEIHARLAAKGGKAAKEELMFSRRSLSVFAAAFGMVLIAGIAVAQVGPFAPSEPANDAAVIGEVEIGTTTTTIHKEEPVTEPHDEVVEELKEEPADEPKQEPVGEAEEEPKETAEPHPEDVTPPEFEILHPTDGQRFETKEVVFEGQVEPGARVFAGEFEADVNEDGAWRIVLWLNPGQNVATLYAIDEAGNKSTDTVTVHYDKPVDEPKPPAEEPKPPAEEPKDPPAEEPTEVAFTANQKFGSCEEEIPYDVFWGTATPGSTVYVVSPYGSGTTTAGEAGNWDLRVEFPEAPYDKVFEVVIEGDGGRKVFTFVRLAPPTEK